MRLSIWFALCEGVLMTASIGLITNRAIVGRGAEDGFVDPLIILLWVVLNVAVNGEYKLYDAPTILSARLRPGRMAFASLVSAGLLLLCVLLLRTVLSGAGVSIHGPSWVARDRWLVAMLATNLAAGMAVRLGVVFIARRMSAAGAVAIRLAVLGSGGNMQSFLESMHKENDLPIQVVSVSTLEVQGDGDRVQGRCPLSVVLDSIVAAVRRAEIDMVVIALPTSRTAFIAEAIRRLSATPVDIRLVPDFVPQSHNGLRPGEAVLQIRGVPLLNIRDRPISGWPQVVKVIEDVILAGLMLAFVSPILILVALAIKLESSGPVLFRQKRYGFNNRLISVLKFRTMHEGLRDDDCQRQTTRNDPRITRVGAVLRRFSIDELPQLINVLRGDMSMVGPRPHALATKAAGQPFEDVVDDYMARHQVKPGITGWAQVSGWRGETDTIEKLQKRVEHDLYYIHHWSLMFDLSILLLTLRSVFRNRNVY